MSELCRKTHVELNLRDLGTLECIKGEWVADLKAQRRPSHICSFEGTASLTVARSFVSAVSCRCILSSLLQRNEV